jgi:hypothetical protein
MPPQDAPAPEGFDETTTGGAAAPDQIVDQTTTQEGTDMPDEPFSQDAAADIDSLGDVDQDYRFDDLSGEDAARAGNNADILTGDGSVQAGGDIDGSTIGDGNISADGAQMSESSLLGDVSSNDLDVSADDGSSLAFGDGSSSGIDDGDTSVGANYGNFAGEGDLTNTVDNSVNDSGNTSDSFNSDFEATDNSTSEAYDISDSGNTDNSFTDFSSDDDYTSTTDDDFTSTDNSSYESSWSDSTTETSDDDFTSTDNSSYDSSWSDSTTATSDDDVDWSDSSSESYADNSVSDDDFQDYDGGASVPDDAGADFGS